MTVVTVQDLEGDGHAEIRAFAETMYRPVRPNERATVVPGRNHTAGGVIGY